MHELLARYAATAAAMQSYQDALPPWVHVWLVWMFGLFGLAIVFVFRRPEARLLALTMIASLVAYNVASMAFGVGRFPGIAYVILWPPLALSLFRSARRIEPCTRFDRVFALWLRLATATLAISVAFDVYNVGYSILNGVP